MHKTTVTKQNINLRNMGSFFSSIYHEPVTGGSEDDHSGIKTFHSSERWQLHFNSMKDSSQLMVVDFAASWCGPCKFMEPVVKAMAAKYTDVQFAKIDVDELRDVAREFGVDAMPTFVLLKGGREVDRVIGAKKDELIKKIEEHRVRA